MTVSQQLRICRLLARLRRIPTASCIADFMSAEMPKSRVNVFTIRSTPTELP